MLWDTILHQKMITKDYINQGWLKTCFGTFLEGFFFFARGWVDDGDDDPIVVGGATWIAPSAYVVGAAWLGGAVSLVGDSLCLLGWEASCVICSGSLQVALLCPYIYMSLTVFVSSNVFHHSSLLQPLCLFSSWTSRVAFLEVVTADQQFFL